MHLGSCDTGRCYIPTDKKEVKQNAAPAKPNQLQGWETSHYPSPCEREVLHIWFLGHSPGPGSGDPEQEIKKHPLPDHREGILRPGFFWGCRTSVSDPQALPHRHGQAMENSRKKNVSRF